MFGWEFPPHNSGGLGVACKGLVEGLTAGGVEVALVLPYRMDTGGVLKNVRFADPHTQLTGSSAALYNPYLSLAAFKLLSLKADPGAMSGHSLVDKVLWYAERAEAIAQTEAHDVVHAHDWLTYPAGLRASAVSGKPFVAHVHATEFDRTGNGLPNATVYAIEKAGFEAADQVVAVSEFTKRSIVERYGIPAGKVSVVHNGTEPPPAPGKLPDFIKFLRLQGKKIILFVGRLTLQKGPDYFLRTAKRVIAERPDAHFVVAGSGDMDDQLRHLATELGIADHLTFAGFLRGSELSAVYQAADAYAMPSVSEPFGLTALEALSFGVPAVISRQSGVSEVTRHCFKSDFWDVDDMASKILAVLKYPALKKSLAQEAPKEAARSHWHEAARKCRAIYEKLISL